ncbi:MAG: (2Fe-2S) ferredoxin domain-containing protein [Coriobacteriales bacterium]|nr:(2Fe-2S) ferredoxin domain-containing protein [Coriobacteriales bacterium]
MVSPKYHLFICNGSKFVGDKLGTCHSQGANALVQQLVEEIEDRELGSDVLINTASCFAVCGKGPVMVVYPEGVWYGGLDSEAIETIVEEHLEGGQPVAKYLL